MQIGEFDLPPDGIAGGPEHKCFVGFALNLGDRFEGFDDRFGEAFGTKALKVPAGAIFDDVMEYGGDAFIFGLKRKHHPERMQDIRSAGFVALASMGLDGDGDGTFESAHGFPFQGQGLRHD